MAFLLLNLSKAFYLLIPRFKLPSQNAAVLLYPLLSGENQIRVEGQQKYVGQPL